MVERAGGPWSDFAMVPRDFVESPAVEDPRKSRPFAFQCAIHAPVEEVRAADEIVRRTPELRHQLNALLGDEEEKLLACSGCP